MELRAIVRGITQSRMLGCFEQVADKVVARIEAVANALKAAEQSKDAALIADLRRVYLALEDANFHDENEVVTRAIAALGGGKAKP